MKYEDIFIDTNILVYAHDTDASDKHVIAKKLILKIWTDSIVPCISAQVLHELFVNLLKRNITQELASQACEHYCSWRVIENDKTLFLAALEIMPRYKISFWDSLIIAAAARARAKIIWSEDLSHGQSYNDIRVVNPLRPD